MRRTVPVAWALAAVAPAGCGGRDSTDDCTGIDCTENGMAAGRIDGACTAYDCRWRRGLYGVADAGAVEIYLERDGLTLVQIRPTDDWEVDVTSDTGIEIAIDFVRRGEDLVFHAWVEDDTISAQWCR